MACYFPVKAWMPPDGAQDRRLIWKRSKAEAIAGARPLEVGCGKCQGCRADRAGHWKTRLLCEYAHLQQRAYSADSLGAICGEAWFVCLTYNDEHLPADYSVSRREMTLFMKRLRTYAREQFGPLDVRFFAVGEYGEQFMRPHYHVILYGLPIGAELEPSRMSKAGFPLYRSAFLEKVWPKGFVEVGNFDAASASYTAGYAHKKVGGPQADEHYRRVHPLTGEVVQVQREFLQMSLKPAIGLRWFQEFSGDVQGATMTLPVSRDVVPVPSYFRRKRLEADPNPEERKRRERWEAEEYFRETAHNRTADRLAVRREVHRLRTQGLARGGA